MIIPTTQGAPQGTDIALETALATIGSASRQDLQSTLSSADTELNKLFGDRNATLTDGGTVSFDGSTVSFTEPLLLILNSNANTPGNANNPPLTISLGSSSVPLNNGDMWYAVVNRAASTATTSTANSGTGLPTVNASNNEVFLLAKRSDSVDGTKSVYFRDGSCLVSGDSVRLGRSGGGSGSGGGSKNYLSSIVTSNGTNNIDGNFEGANINGWSTASSALTNGFPSTVSTQSAYVSGQYQFVLSSPITIETHSGAIYTNNSKSFTVVNSEGDGIALTCTGTGNPTASGTLTLSSGSGQSTLNYSSYYLTTASSNLSLSTISSNQLEGKYSLSYHSTSALTAGDMLISNVFYIDNSDQAKVLNISFSYEVIAGASNLNFSGTSNNTFGVAIYDVTNSAWIMPAGVWSMNQISGIGKAIATFQTTANSTQYQLAMFTTFSGGGSATTLYLDSFEVGPQTVVMGPAMTDWQPYTLTIGATTTPPTPGAGAVSSALWRRVGDSMEISYNFYQTSSGSAGTDTYLFPIPTGYTIDSTKITPNNGPIGAGGNAVGFGQISNTASISTAEAVPLTVMLNSTNNFRLTIISGSGTLNTIGSSFLAMNAPNYYITFTAKVPIAGWSSNTSMSSDTDTRVVAAQLKLSSSPSTTANTPVKFDTVLADTHAAYSASTGLYTCPVSGFYRVSTILIGSVNAACYLGKNGSNYVYLTSELTTIINSGTSTVKCNAGDTLGIYVDTTTTINGTLSSATFERISGPAVVAATESVGWNGYSQSTQSVPATFTQIGSFITFADSHNAFNTATSVYTVPVSGRYQISGSFQFALGAPYLVCPVLYKNGAAIVIGTRAVANAAYSTSPLLSTSYMFNAGDQISFYAYCAAATSLAGGSGGIDQNWSIFRTGNA